MNVFHVRKAELRQVLDQALVLFVMLEPTQLMGCIVRHAQLVCILITELQVAQRAQKEALAVIRDLRRVLCVEQGHILSMVWLAMTVLEEHILSKEREISMIVGSVLKEVSRNLAQVLVKLVLLGAMQ